MRRVDPDHLADAMRTLADALTGFTAPALADGDPVRTKRIASLRATAWRTVRAVVIPAAWHAGLTPPGPRRHGRRIRPEALADWAADHAEALVCSSDTIDDPEVVDLLFLASAIRAERREQGALPTGRLHLCEEAG